MSRKHTAEKAPKFFRVAVEGATVDGRTIQRQWLTQAAANFDNDVRGARVWVEHMRSMWSDSPFSAQGDVVALKAEEIKEGKLAGKMALFAAIKPLPELVALNKRGKKIYTSIEIEPKFADTGEAYMTGLAVTDDPASLGTEVLKFNSKRDSNKYSTEFMETTMEFSAAGGDDDEEDDDDATAEVKAARAESQGMFKRLMKRFARSDGDSAQTYRVIEAMGNTIADLQDQLEEVEEQNTKRSKDYAKLAKRLDALEKQGDELQTFRTKLEGEPDNSGNRPAAVGGDGYEKADC